MWRKRHESEWRKTARAREVFGLSFFFLWESFSPTLPPSPLPLTKSHTSSSFLLPPPPSSLLPPLSFSSSSFSVYAAGNYTTAQFIKFGIPLQLLQFATVTVIFLLRPWKWILCGASVLLLVTVGLGIWLAHGASLSGLKRRAVLGKARRSGLFVAGEKAGAANGAAAPKAP
jgi:hypothetical protein